MNSQKIRGKALYLSLTNLFIVGLGSRFSADGRSIPDVVIMICSLIFLLVLFLMLKAERIDKKTSC